MPANSLTDRLFSNPAMGRVFSAENTVQRMLDVEAALAHALAVEDVIPEAAVVPIQSACKAARIDMKALSAAARHAGNLAIPLVKQLTAEVASIDAQAARYVHWGATSQDIIDTGMVLQLREAIDLLEVELAELADALAGLAHRHRDTPMIGRTWLQHALPITFGLKAAGWLDAVLRHQQRLAALRADIAVLQFGGAAGTLASLGNRGLPVADALARALALQLPELPWHAHRDRMAECATVFGLLTGTLAKIARDLSLQMQTEVGELAEPSAPGRGGSSTMPHKRNPVACATALAAAARVPALVSTMLAAMDNEHERALGGWQAEWDTLPEIASLCGASLSSLRDVIEGLEVNAERMHANIGQTRGLVMAEAVSLALAAHIGRAHAHERVEAACRAALAQDTGLREALAADPDIATRLSAAELDKLFEPLAYTGEAGALVDRVLAAHRARKG